MNATRQAILELNNSLMMLNQSMTGQVPLLKDLKDSFLTLKPMMASLGGVVGRVSDLVNPIERLIEGFDKASDVQKKLLALNSNTASFLEANTKELEGMRGSLTDNVAELAESFSEGIRFSSKSYNVLRDRMQETGQSTAKLRETTKQLINATGGNVNAITRLTDSNMRIAKESMISNEKLIDALARNEEAIDMASVVGMGEEQVNQLQKITAALSERGVSDKQQQKVIDLLFSTDSNIVALRSQIGLDTNVGEKIMLGQTDFATELNKASENINKLFVVTQGADKLNRTSFLLEGVQRSDLLKAATLTNTLLQQDAKNKVEPTKEDKYYDQMMTYIQESKSTFERYTLENYKVVEEIPSLLGAIKNAMLAYFAMQTISQARDYGKSFSARKAVEERLRASNPSAPDIEIQARTNRALDRMEKAGTLGTGFGARTGRAMADFESTLRVGGRNAVISLSNAFKGGGITRAITTGITGLFKSTFTVIGGLFKGLLGPFALLITALEYLPTIIDWISGWFGKSKEDEKRDNDNKSVDDLNKSIGNLQKSFDGASKSLDINTNDMNSSFELVTDSNGKFLTEAEKQRAKQTTQTPAPTQVVPPAPQAPVQTPASTQVVPPAPQAPVQTPAPTQVVPPAPQAPVQTSVPIQLAVKASDSNEGLSRRTLDMEREKNNINAKFQESVQDLKNKDEFFSRFLNNKEIVSTASNSLKREQFRTGPTRNESLISDLQDQLFDLSEAFDVETVKDLQKFSGVEVQTKGQATPDILDDVYQISKSVDFLNNRGEKEVAQIIAEYTKTSNKQIDSVTRILEKIGKDSTPLVLPSTPQSPVQTPAATQVVPPAPQAPVQTPTPTQVVPPAPQAPVQTPAASQISPPLIQSQQDITKDLRTQTYQAIVTMTDQIAFSAKNLKADQLETLQVSKVNQDLERQLKLLQDNKNNQQKIQEILADTMRMSEEYNQKISSDTTISANTQKEILNKGIKIRKEEATQSSGQTLESEAIKYLMAATSGGLSKKDSQDMSKLTDAINGLKDQVALGRDTARRGYVGRNSAR